MIIIQSDYHLRPVLKPFPQTDDRLSRLRMEFIRHRQLYAGRNTLIAFTRYDGVADEDSLMKVRLITSYIVAVWSVS